MNRAFSHCLALGLASLLILIGLGASEAPKSATDWPAFHGGGPLLGEAAPIGGPSMHVRWTFRAEEEAPAPAKPGAAPVNAGGPSSFEAAASIVGNTVYVADKAGTLHAIDLATGKRKWFYRSEDGFGATPAVADGKVLIGDEGGTFHAVSAETGAKLWTFDAGSSVHGSANVVGSRVIFGNDGAQIFCLNLADGTKAWDAKAGDRINGAPAIGNGAAFISGCDAQLRALNVEDGKERFSTDLGALCPGSPALLSDRILVGTDQGRVLCLASDGKKQLWLFEGIENHAMVYTSPAVSEGIVVVGARDRNVYGIDLATGAKKWSFPTRGDVDSSPVISGGRVYVGSKDKKLYVLDLKSGKRLWEFPASRGILAAPAIGQGVVVIGDTGGSLYCLEPAK